MFKFRKEGCRFCCEWPGCGTTGRLAAPRPPLPREVLEGGALLPPLCCAGMILLVPDLVTVLYEGDGDEAAVSTGLRIELHAAVMMSSVVSMMFWTWWTVFLSFTHIDIATQLLISCSFAIWQWCRSCRFPWYTNHWYARASIVWLNARERWPDE